MCLDEANKTVPNEIQEQGQTLKALNELSTSATRRFEITEATVENLVTILQRVEYAFAAPAIKALLDLNEIVDCEYAGDPVDNQ